MQRYVFILASFLLISIPLNTNASCGNATCSLATHLDALGFASEPGWQLGLRYEYIDQSTPRNGTSEVAVGQIHQHHDEVYTINRNFIATIDYRSSETWGVSIAIPYVRRDHYHIHTHLGVPYDERWDIAALGDVRVVAFSRGLQFGLTLPTGDTQAVNDDGDLAERTLQPGSGTTGLVLGYTKGAASTFWDLPAHWFVQFQLQTPLAEHDDYREGAQYHVDSGIVFRPSSAISPVVQFNAVVKDRDEGLEAEPANSGGEFVWVSPGVSGTIIHTVRAFGFVQLPVYQRVNGVQLTSDWNISIGVNWQL